MKLELSKRTLHEIMVQGYIYSVYSARWRNFVYQCTFPNARAIPMEKIREYMPKYAEAARVPCNMEDSKLMLGGILFQYLLNDEEYKNVAEDMKKIGLTAKEFRHNMNLKLGKKEGMILQKFTAMSSSESIAAYIKDVVSYGKTVDADSKTGPFYHPFLERLNNAYTENRELFEDNGIFRADCPEGTVFYDRDGFIRTDDGVYLPNMYMLNSDFHGILYRSDDVLGKAMDFLAMPDYIRGTVKEAKALKGKVLILDGGIGLMTAEAVRNENVTSVTVVVKEEEYADFFREHIVPLTQAEIPVTVISGDYEDMLKDIPDGEYDYIISDLLTYDYDGCGRYLSKLRYFNEKRLLKKYKTTKTVIVTEKEYIQHDVMVHFFDILSSSLQSIPEIAVKRKRNFRMEQQSEILNELLNDETISKPEHLQWYMNPENLLSVINRNI